jgi:putative transposase
MEWKPSKLTREQLEERRLEAGRLLKEGHLSQSQIAARLGVSRTAVSQWAKRYRSGGLKRLRQRVVTGRPSKLTPAQKQTLKQRLRKGALTAGFPTDRWTLERIAALIEQEFGVRYHPHYLPHLLRQLDFTLQTSEPAATERRSDRFLR